MSEERQSREKAFVSMVLQRAGTDKQFAARMRTLETAQPQTEALGTLVAFNVRIEQDAERMPYCVVGASLCRQKAAVDGKLGIGRAIRTLAGFQNGPEDSGTGDSRLSRLVACSDVPELCNVLRPLLNYLASQGISVDHGRLLEEMISYEENQERIKLGWIRDFYANVPDQGEKDGTLP